MRARVDSKEFNAAVRAASKYNKKGGLAVSESILLRVADGSLSVRTTTGSEDCIVWVNAFDPIEDGAVVTLSSVLTPSVFDSGSWVDIHDDGPKLVLDYERASFKLGRMDYGEDDFPVWIGLDPIVGLDPNLLKIAAASTTPFEKIGHPIKSSIHLVPQDTGMAVFGTDGYIGYISHLDSSEIDHPVSVDAQMLNKALSVVGDSVTIGAQEDRIAVSGSVGDVVFSTTSCSNQADLVAGFQQGIDYGPIEVTVDELSYIAMLCDSAVGVYQGSEIQILGNKIWILGKEVDIRADTTVEFPNERSIFKCSTFSRCIRNVVSKDVNVSIKMMESGTSKFWYIDPVEYESRYFMYSAIPTILPESDGTVIATR